MSAEPRLRHVLCALELASANGETLPLAAMIAGRFGASVDALYAPPPLWSFGGHADQVNRLIMEHDGRERLEGMVRALGSSLRVSTHVTRGQAGAVILSHAERHGSDLIVLSASSEAAATVSSVSAGASCAVLSVPGEASAPRALRRILLPVGSLIADAPATAWSISLASRFGAQVTVLRVGSSKPGFGKAQSSPRSLEVPLGDEQQSSVRAGATLLRLQRAGVETPVLDPSEQAHYDAIAEHGETGGFDLIVMGLHTQGDRATDGQGATADLRRRATMPVLSVRTLPQAASVTRLEYEAAAWLQSDAQLALSA